MLKTRLYLLLALIYGLFLTSCVDDRELDTEEFFISSSNEFNFLSFNIEAQALNEGNSGSTNNYFDTVNSDFLTELDDIDIESLGFQFYTENTTNQDLDFQIHFLNAAQNPIISFSEVITAGSPTNPNQQLFDFELTPEEITNFTTAESIEFTINQEETNSQNGQLFLQSIINFRYRYSP